MGKLLPVTKEVSDYTNEELEQFREQFAPVAQKIHHLNRLSIVFIALMFGNLLISIVVSLAMTEGNILEWIPAIITLAILCISSGLVLFFLVCLIFVVGQSTYRLSKCPACNKLLIRRRLTYCPECGSLVDHSNWLSGPKCNDCGKLYVKIHFCPHCGVFLDEKGFS